jgi:hypothetical protein
VLHSTLSRRGYAPEPHLAARRPRWTVTIDAAYPPGITEVPDGRLAWFLHLLEEHVAAFTMPNNDESDLAVTLAVVADELDEPTALNAAAYAAAVVHEHLRALGLGDDWKIIAIEVCADDTNDVVQILPMRHHD